MKTQSKNQVDVLSAVEQILWDELRFQRFAIFRFRRRSAVKGFTGNFYSSSGRLVVEVQSLPLVEPSPADLRRNDRFEKAGVRLLRFRNSDIQQNLQLVLEVICEACMAGRRHAMSKSSRGDLDVDVDSDDAVPVQRSR